MVGFVPKEMFFTKGVGKHREKLTSFELALRSAGIAACNLVRVSSIFPPNCRILSRAQDGQQAKVCRRRHFAGRPQLRGDCTHHQRDDFQYVARAFARLIPGHC